MWNTPIPVSFCLRETNFFGSLLCWMWYTATAPEVILLISLRVLSVTVNTVLCALVGITQEQINTARSAKEQMILKEVKAAYECGEDISQKDSTGATIVSPRVCPSNVFSLPVNRAVWSGSQQSISTVRYVAAGPLEIKLLFILWLDSRIMVEKCRTARLKVRSR